jgi:hypothetical protein
MSWHKEIFDSKDSFLIDSFYRLDWRNRAMNFKLMRDAQVDLVTLFNLKFRHLINNESKDKRFLTKENI